MNHARSCFGALASSWPRAGFLAFIVAASSVAAPFVRAAASRPNLVLIMTDDQGYGDLGITGNPVLETPNIDRFARESAGMLNFYVSPVCSPTRACLMTGRYNQRTRVLDTFKGRSMMDPGETTVAEALHEAGYATGIFGKWHLGDEYPMRPNDQGFEEALVLRGGGLAQPSEPIENRRRYTDPVLFHNDQPVQTKGYCTDVYFRAAMEFMREARNSGRPFFAYIAPNAPHGPFHDVPVELYEKYKQKDLSSVLTFDWKNADTLARIFAMEENIDQNVGRLMAFLRDQGWAEDTLVIYMADNGPDGRRFVGPMRGKKSEVHDGGIRSPFFARWPARFRVGTRSDQIAAHIDVMPTLLDAANVPVPPGLKLDGRSLLPLLEGRESTWPDRTLVLQAHRGDEPVATHNIAVRTQRWKLVHPSGFGPETMPPDVPFELYDILRDPGETNNLAATQPQILRQLSEAYATWFADIAATRPDTFAPPRIIIGSDADPTTMLTWQDWRVDEPTGWGKGGRWLLRAEQDATYQVTLRWPQPIEPARITLHAGGTTANLTLDRPSDRVEFSEIRLPRGDLELSVEIHRGTELDQPYQVLLRRR